MTEFPSGEPGWCFWSRLPRPKVSIQTLTKAHYILYSKLGYSNIYVCNVFSETVNKNVSLNVLLHVDMV